MTVSKVFSLESSHQLPRHPGKCARLHGHSWRVTIEVHGKQDPTTHFVLDYNHLSAIINPLVDFLDHRHLNFICQYPSSENLLQVFAAVLLPMTSVPGVWRYIVKISETQKTQSIWDSSVPYDRQQLQDNSGWHMPAIPVPLPNVDHVIIGGAAITPRDLLTIQTEWVDTLRQAARQIEALFPKGGTRSADI